MLAHKLSFYQRVRCFRSSLHAEECCSATLFGYMYPIFRHKLWRSVLS